MGYAAIPFCSVSYRPRDLARPQTACAYIHMPGGAVDNRLDALDIRFPHPVGTPVGVGYFNTKRYTLVTKFTLRHIPRLLFRIALTPLARRDRYHIRLCPELQGNFFKMRGFFQSVRYGL